MKVGGLPALLRRFCFNPNASLQQRWKWRCACHLVTFVLNHRFLLVQCLLLFGAWRKNLGLWFLLSFVACCAHACSIVHGALIGRCRKARCPQDQGVKDAHTHLAPFCFAFAVTKLCFSSIGKNGYLYFLRSKASDFFLSSVSNWARLNSGVTDWLRERTPVDHRPFISHAKDHIALLW